MGTNYYLIKKMKYTENTPVSLGCDSYDNEVQKLNNGWLLRNTYYPTLEELSNDFTQEIHIGKSSMGWHFTLCIYPAYGISSFEDWEKLFYSGNCTILNEYDEEISPEEMISIITDRKALEWTPDISKEKILERETKILKSQNELMESLGFKSNFFTDYEDLLEYNHAVRGNKGLWKHDRKDKFYVENPDKLATYDYVLSGNDPETSYIFS